MTQTQTQTQTRDITLTQALNEAMREEMRADERVFIMGEDIQSGVYGASAGLAQEFGFERVRTAPCRKTRSWAQPWAQPPSECGPSSKRVLFHVGCDGLAGKPGV